MSKKKEKDNKEKGQGEDGIDKLGAIVNIVSKKINGGILYNSEHYGFLSEEETVSSGSDGIDHLLNGGYRLGRTYEIYGKNSSGKTTLAMCAVSSFQSVKKACLYVDVEQTFDEAYAASLGIDLKKNFILHKPSSAEEAIDIIDTFVKSGQISLVILDSVAGLVPEAELERGIYKESPGAQAKLMSKTCRMLIPSMEKHKTTWICLNQIRKSMDMFDPGDKSPGGEALPFYATARLETKRAGWIKEGEVIIGQQTKVTCRKNKLGPPMRETILDIIFGLGIDPITDLSNRLFETPLVGLEKAGSWIKLDGESIAHGEDKFKLLLRENEDAREEFRKRLRIIKETPPVSYSEIKFDPIKLK